MSFLELVAAVFAARFYPNSPDVASAAEGRLAAFIAENPGTQITDSVSGIVSDVVVFGSYPFYTVKPAE
jgi:hypothetical protein